MNYSSTNSDEIEKENLLLDFRLKVETSIQSIRNRYNTLQQNTNWQLCKEYSNKFTFLKKKESCPTYNCILDIIKESFDEEQLKIITEHYGSKIQGLYKHGQTNKTALSNNNVLHSVLNLQSISICITKNVLESQEQWISRLLHLLKKINDTIIKHN